MSDSATFWSRIRQAREQLAQQVLGHPAVSLVDIGLAEPRPGAHPVLRVHLRPGDTSDLMIPATVAGFTVQVIGGDYRLE